MTPDNPPEVAALLVHSLDGFLTESVFYTEKDGQDQLQAADTAAYLQEILAIPLAADKAVWTLDYVREQALQQEDEALGKKAGYVSMAVGNKNLDRLPKGKVPHVNSRDIETPYKKRKISSFSSIRSILRAGKPIWQPLGTHPMMCWFWILRPMMVL